MKTRWQVALCAGLAVFLLSLALIALGGSDKERKPGRNEAKGGNSGDIVLSNDDLKAATPLINQIVTRMNAAAKKLSENNLDGARSEVAAAERLFDTVQSLLSDGDSPRPQRPLHRGLFGGAPRTQWPSPFDDDSDFWQDEWDPFRAVQKMHERMQQLLDAHRSRFGSGFGPDFDSGFYTSPSMDLTEQGDKYVVRLDMPGLDKSNIKVNVEGRLLTISGQSESSSEEKDGNRIIRRERRSGMFHRSITLPGPVLADKVEAKYENGVLVVTIPKADEQPPAKSVPVY